MCEICLHSPCLTQCPNKIDNPVHTCTECKEAIYSGDKYAQIDGEFYCEYCLDDMPFSELLDKLGCPVEIAEYETKDEEF